MEKKYSDQIYSENLLLKRILNVTIISPEDDLLAKMYNGPMTYSEEVNQLLDGKSQSLMENKSVFDTLISNLLGEDNCNGLNLLMKAYGSINEEKDKSINAKEPMQKFLTFFKEIIVNYFVLILMNPELFSNMLPQSDDDEGLDLSAVRLSQILEVWMPPELLKQVNDKIIQDYDQQFDELWEKTLLQFFKSINNVTIMGKAKTLADIF